MKQKLYGVGFTLKTKKVERESAISWITGAKMSCLFVVKEKNGTLSELIWMYLRINRLLRWKCRRDSISREMWGSYCAWTLPCWLRESLEEVGDRTEAENTVRIEEFRSFLEQQRARNQVLSWLRRWRGPRELCYFRTIWQGRCRKWQNCDLRSPTVGHRD